MQIEVWKTLLRRVPAEQIDNLMMMTAQGTELNVQASCAWRRTTWCCAADSPAPTRTAAFS